VSRAAHPHRFAVFAASKRDPENDCADVTKCNAFMCGHFPPRVITHCQVPGCIAMETSAPTRRHRKVPMGMTPDQFQAMQNGSYFGETLGAP
jgi:hypothetical protein